MGGHRGRTGLSTPAGTRAQGLRSREDISVVGEWAGRGSGGRGFKAQRGSRRRGWRPSPQSHAHSGCLRGPHGLGRPEVVQAPVTQSLPSAGHGGIPGAPGTPPQEGRLGLGKAAPGAGALRTVVQARVASAPRGGFPHVKTNRRKENRK